MSNFSWLELDLPEDLKTPAPPAADPAPAPANLPPPAFPAYRPLVGEYRTAHGAKGSPRMHRCYRWFRDHQLGIGDWSTDSCVKAVLPKLEQLLAIERAHLDALPEGPDRKIQNELVRDIAGIMRRVPENRLPTVRG